MTISGRRGTKQTVSDLTLTTGGSIKQQAREAREATGVKNERDDDYNVDDLIPVAVAHARLATGQRRHWGQSHCQQKLIVTVTAALQ